MSEIFSYLTEDALKSLLQSHKISQRLHSTSIGTEHLLLGIFYQQPGIASAILYKFHFFTSQTEKIIEKMKNSKSNQYFSRRHFNIEAKQILYKSLKKREKLKQRYIGTEHFLFEILFKENSVAFSILKQLNIDLIGLKTVVSNLLQSSNTQTIFERNKRFFNIITNMYPTIFLNRPYLSFSKEEKTDKVSYNFNKATPNLDKFSINISEQVKSKYKFKLFGRDQEIREIINILAQLKNNSPILIGEPGVGRRTTIEALAQSINNRLVPLFLRDVTIHMLKIESMISKSKFRGEFEEKLTDIANEMIKNQKFIVVIHNIHNLLDSKENELSVNIENFLKSTRSRNILQFIGTSTEFKYTEAIEQNFDLARYFQKIIINELDTDVATQAILRIKDQFEEHHNLSYKRKIVKQAVTLSKKYIKNRFLPEKAIEILDQAGAKVRLNIKNVPTSLENKRRLLNLILHRKALAVTKNDYLDAYHCYSYELKLKNEIKILARTIYFSSGNIYPQITSDLILDLISKKAQIPITQERKGAHLKRLLNMEKILHKQIIGQENAVSAVSKAIRRAQSGFRNMTKPIASFIFAGPTGVGKTELTKSLARYLFNSEENLIRFDMSEFVEKYSIARLVGAPPGYVGHEEGGQLTDAIFSKPYSIILFDEVEKSHPDIYDLLLQLLDDGRLTDSKGKVVDFSNTVVILTTNLGATILEENRIPEDINLKTFPEKGWSPTSNLEAIFSKEAHALVLKEIKDYFRPEFVNRLDDIIVFHHLTLSNIWDICRLSINKIQKDLSERHIFLNVDLSAQSYLTQKGYNPSFGARPLRRTVTTELEDVLSDKFLTGDLIPGSLLNITRAYNRMRGINKLKIYTVDNSSKKVYSPTILKNIFYFF
uniref:ATP-dependent clp protease ATP-binding subunit n=1 Tax=Nitzschia sp. PL1-4 TaxID=2083272 RepID=A0A2Z5ZB12_9STRA|nr:ATP-dependent clp protease ATP-binding subunit [Nitzschia sp. PL1-4]BBC77557.1 ATP-dependent clp protease ATP-binding subunit [Nitzschia sp. PL1-4]